MTTMKMIPCLLFFVLQLSSAFHVQPAVRPAAMIKKPLCATKGGGDMSFHTSGNFRNDVDMDRAKDCAEHFGKCSIKEMQQLKHGKPGMSAADLLTHCGIDFFRVSHPALFSTNIPVMCLPVHHRSLLLLLLLYY
jgi:hypothetical protein